MPKPKRATAAATQLIRQTVIENLIAFLYGIEQGGQQVELRLSLIAMEIFINYTDENFPFLLGRERRLYL
jgi:hypothetical protein